MAAIEFGSVKSTEILPLREAWMISFSSDNAETAPEPSSPLAPTIRIFMVAP